MRWWLNEFFNDHHQKNVVKATLANPNEIREVLEDFKVMTRSYYCSVGRYPNLKKPELFSEKIIFKRLFHRSNIYTRLSDKYQVRIFVKEKVGEKILPTLYQVHKKPEDILFGSLPGKFVIKANHGCGYNLFIEDKEKINKEKICIQLSRWLQENFYYKFREWQYKDIEPCILIEEYLRDKTTRTADDYKFYCFEGKVHFIHCLYDRFTGFKENFYDKDWNLQDFYYVTSRKKSKAARPENLRGMIEIAEKLSEGFDYVRVDLYNINSKIYFGEMTFTPLGGYMKFRPASTDVMLGKLFNLRKYES